MNPNLHTLRTTASFSPRWRLVPLAIAGTAAVAACFVQALTSHLLQDDTVVEGAPARPAPAASDGA